MKALFIHSDKISLGDILWALYEMQMEPDIYPDKIKMQEYSENEKKALACYMTGKDYDFVITYDFSRTVAEACLELKVKYLSWIFDSPQTDLYSESAKSEYNYVFVFDKAQYYRMEKEGLKHLYYLPLAANVSRTSGLIITEEDEEKYSHEIAFVGNLYQDNGYNERAVGLTPETGAMVNQIIQHIALNWGKGYECFGVLGKELADRIYRELRLGVDKEIQADAVYMLELYLLSRKISEIDRVCILNALAREHHVTLYTKSDVSNLEGVDTRGYIEYDTEAPKVFYLSKINLNITMRSIETGAPQRIFDIMSAGGFVMSNYQEELEELFVPGEEIVLFHNVKELLEKVEYYLNHEEERIRIAMNGYKKVRDCYNTGNAVKKMLETVFEA